MRTSIASPLVAAAVLFAASPAFGGSLGDFSDSYQGQQNDSSDDDSDSWDSDSSSTDDDDSETTWSGDDSSDARRRDRRFDFGRAPYTGRGTRSGAAWSDRAYARRGTGSAATFERSDESHVLRDQQWTFRTVAIASSRLDAGGGEAFFKWSSANQLLGFSFSYQYADEFLSRANLGLGWMAYEPSLFLQEHWNLSWDLGVSFIHARGGVADAGAVVGLAAEYFPVEPLFLSSRLQAHFFPGVVVGDIRGSLGMFVSDHLAVEASLRRLGIRHGESLSTGGLGVRYYLGL